MRRSSALVGVLLAIAVASTAAAQSGQTDLAAVARAAEAAKSTIPKAKKSYTNADLSPEGLPPAPAKEPVTGFMSASQGKPVSADEMLKLSEAKSAADLKQKEPDEVWTKQATAIRRQVEILSTRLAELKSRPTNPSDAQQKKTDQQVADIVKQMEGFRKRWAGLEDAARTAKVDIALILPEPKFPS